MLAERIDADMKDAARAKDARRLGTLRLLKSQMKYREIEKAKPLDDADVVGVIGSPRRSTWPGTGPSWRRTSTRRSPSSRPICPAS